MGASLSTSTRTVGRSAPPAPAPCAVPLASMMSSRASASAEHPGALAARWSTSIGLCGDVVCGSHLRKSQSRAELPEAKEQTASSAGEWSDAIWSTKERAAPRALARCPAMPTAPSVRGVATTGTSWTTSRPCSSSETASQASALERPTAGILIADRDGRVPRPSRSSPKPLPSRRRVHSRALRSRTAVRQSTPLGCSARRVLPSTSSDPRMRCESSSRSSRKSAIACA